MKFARLTAIAGAVAVLAGLGLGSGAQASPSAPMTVLKQNILARLNTLKPTGAAKADRVVNVTVGLRRPDVAGEMRLYRALYDAKSPQYHHFLTPAEFASRFGVSQTRFDHLTSWLQSGGLKVVHQSAARDVVEVSGTTRQVERVFKTTLKMFSFHGISFMANTAAPSVPADLDVISVIGLNDLQKFHTANSTNPAHPAHPATAAAPNTGTVSPQDLWSIYNLPGQNTGQGQKVAVFGWGATDNVINDLRIFEKNNSLRPTPVRVVHAGDGPFTDTAGEVEWDIDMQAEKGMAPDALRLDLYFGKSEADAVVAAMFSSWVSDPDAPKQANASFSTCERDPLNPVWYNPALDGINVSRDPIAAPLGTQLGNDLQPVADQTLRQGTLQGQTLFTSTGDTGPGCAIFVAPVVGGLNGIGNQGPLLMGYPAISPYAVAVGGTALYTDGNQPAARFLERGWEYGGGGTSFFVTQPAYQSGVTNIIGRCIVDPDGNPTNTGQPCRGIPDVSAISGDTVGNGYAIVAGGANSGGAGTSLSSPLWAGMWARIQAASPNLAGEGFANESFYKVGKDPKKYAKDFYDVVVGDNVPYPALPGWDYVTGWGAPHIDGMMLDIAGKILPTLNILPSLPTPACVPVTAISPGPLLSLRMQDDNASGAPYPADPSYTYVGATLPNGTLGNRKPARNLAASFNEFTNGAVATAMPTFTTPALQGPMTVVGDAVIETWVEGASASTQAGKLEAQVLDVAPDGTSKTIVATGGDLDIAADPSAPVQSKFPLHLAAPYTIATGHQLALAIAEFHSPETAADTIFYDSDAYPSGLTLSTATIKVVKGCPGTPAGSGTPIPLPLVAAGGASRPARLPATGSSFPYLLVAGVFLAGAAALRRRLTPACDAGRGR